MYTEIVYIVSNRVLSVYVRLIMLFLFLCQAKCPVCSDSKSCATLSVIGHMLSGRVVELMTHVTANMAALDVADGGVT